MFNQHKDTEEYVWIEGYKLCFKDNDNNIFIKYEHFTDDGRVIDYKSHLKLKKLYNYKHYNYNKHKQVNLFSLYTHIDILDLIVPYLVLKNSVLCKVRAYIPKSKSDCMELIVDNKFIVLTDIMSDYEIWNTIDMSDYVHHGLPKDYYDFIEVKKTGLYNFISLREKQNEIQTKFEQTDNKTKMDYICEQIINILTEIKYEQVVSKYATTKECREVRDTIDDIILFTEQKFKKENN